MVKVKLLEGRTYSANEVNRHTNKTYAAYMWKAKGDVVDVPENYMRHWDIAGGLRRGILGLVREKKAVVKNATV